MKTIYFDSFNKKLSYMVAVLAGACLPFAFAPFNYTVLAFFAPALLYFLWIHAGSLKQTLWQAFWFGVAVFGIGASWIFISIHTFGQTNIAIAGFITALFVTILALFLVLQAYLFKQCCSRYPVLIFALTWALCEWLRSWLFSGFPWLFLAHSQINSPLAAYAPILGTYGTSFLVAFIAALMVHIMLSYTNRKVKNSSNKQGYLIWQQEWQIISLLFLISIFITGYLLTKINWTAPVGKPIKVSLVQGNIPQEMKWDPQAFAATKHIYRQLTEQHLDSQIIIWPEAAIPALFNEVQDYFKGLDQLTAQHHVALVTGVPMQLFDRNQYANALLALGNGQGIYFKRHLVPFGEYVPLQAILRGIIGFFDLPMSDFSGGAMYQQAVMAAGIPLGAFICYEIAYPEVVRASLPQAQVLVTISNDAWFGDSFAPWQHLQIAQFQTLMTNRPLLFVSNTGVTAIADAQGRIQAIIPQFKQAVLTSYFQPMQGSTPWVCYGDSPILLVFFVVLIILGYKQKSKL